MTSLRLATPADILAMQTLIPLSARALTVRAKHLPMKAP